jgi:hypothetical protein
MQGYLHLSAKYGGRKYSEAINCSERHLLSAVDKQASKATRLVGIFLTLERQLSKSNSPAYSSRQLEFSVPGDGLAVQCIMYVLRPPAARLRLHWIYGWEGTSRPVGLEIGQDALWGALLSLGTFRIHN